MLASYVIKPIARPRQAPIAIVGKKIPAGICTERSSVYIFINGGQYETDEPSCQKSTL